MSENDLFKHISGFSGGLVVYEPHSGLGPRWQQFLQLLYVKEGSMTIQVDEEVRKLGPGDVTLLLPGHRETFRMDEQKKTCHGWTTASEVRLTAAEIRRLEALPDTLELNHRMREVLRLLEPLFLLFPEEASLERDALSLTLLGQMLRAGTEDGNPRRPLPAPVQQACAFLEEHYAKSLTVSDLARAAGVSHAHLIRLFQRHLQQTPMQAVWNRRLQEGERLLRHTGLSISEVAYACGFQTPDHFSRRMKARFGHSPRELRRCAWMG